jgi:oligoribonuclease
MKNEYLLWLDLETTGFDERRCSIIEVAWTIKHKGPPAAPKREEIQSYFLETDQDTYWEEGARKMHVESGLYDLTRTTDAMSLDEVKLLLLADIRDEVLADSGEEKPVFYLAGSSVHFDRRFLDQHIPGVAKMLHHRIFDVSSHRLFLETLACEFPEIEKLHRAAEDVMNSINLFRLCFDHVTA